MKITRNNKNKYLLILNGNPTYSYSLKVDMQPQSKFKSKVKATKLVQSVFKSKNFHPTIEKFQNISPKSSVNAIPLETCEKAILVCSR